MHKRIQDIPDRKVIITHLRIGRMAQSNRTGEHPTYWYIVTAIMGNERNYINTNIDKA